MIEIPLDQTRFKFRSLDFALKAANRLKNAIREKRPDFRKGTAQAFFAKICGYRDWKELCSCIDPASSDPIDQELIMDSLIARRNFQISRLAELTGMDSDIVAKIIHDAEPTGSSSGRLKIGRSYDEPYFKLDPLPDGKIGMEAFAPMLERYHELDIPVFRTLSYLETMLTDPDTVVQVKKAVEGTLLSVIDNGREVLSVQYARIMGLWLDGDDDDLTPLRPDSAQFRVYYALWEMKHEPRTIRRTRSPGLERAFEMAGYFILMDILLTSCLHAQSLKTDFYEVKFEIGFDEFERYGMEEMGDSIREAYEEILNYEDEVAEDDELEYSTDKYAIRYSSLQDILPFEYLAVDEE